MEEIVEITARLVAFSRLAYAKKWSFFVLFLCMFIGSTLLLARLDLLPNAPFVNSENTLSSFSNDLASDLTRSSSRTFAGTDISATTTTTRVEEPIKIVVPAIDLSATIANPTTTNIAVLDEQLLKGAVRYPTSAKLGETGNVVLFGHSSYLPIVGNQAYKSFNGIQKLKRGDTITVYSADTMYTYVVRTVTKESAHDAAIPLSVPGKVLTLATCNSFGTKSDRFVVTADLVESRLL